ncbi:MAG: zinc finger domain-containing protein, partial [Bdellovibrionales bacterium]
EWYDDTLIKKFSELIEIRVALSKILEDLRQNKVIGSSLDAEVSISASGNKMALLREHAKQLREYFIVSAVSLKEGDFAIEARRASGEKCERCWHYSTQLNSNASLPNICPKCVDALT